MNFFKTVALVLITVNLVGCAGRAANPITVRQVTDERKSCSALQMEISSIENNIQRLIPESNKTGKNVFLAVTGALIFPPLWLFMDLSSAEKEEINAYRMRYDHLMNIYHSKGCK